jgi:hypothetical protein
MYAGFSGRTGEGGPDFRNVAEVEELGFDSLCYVLVKGEGGVQQHTSC